MWLRLAATDTANVELQLKIAFALADGGNSKRAEPFILALTVFHERLTTVDLTGYGLIWCGLALATYASVRRRPLALAVAAPGTAQGTQSVQGVQGASVAPQNVSILAPHKKTPASAGVNRFWHSEGRPEPERRCEKSDA